MDQKSDKRERPSLPLPPYRATLHSVQRPPGKAPHKKPDQSPAPKVYRVDPRGFRELVQQLTGATRPVTPPPLKRPLRGTAPPPLELAAPVISGSADESPTGFLKELLSPSLFSSWYSFPLFSPPVHVGSMEK
ncbi:uncharacterized protein LOC122003707 [Zingiber officinale]|uniref:VQ domain-containing protein n=1 Tax=Zingiber officinale TaxID=94328 RepID=A0A8J5FHJ4_ZINOF|nr:uncharacterized protein LOC122003707 [Zingiber officinale]KAG6489447.1 hypothetical protein ZIOFF_050716 [Zingiber officinale]